MLGKRANSENNGDTKRQTLQTKFDNFKQIICHNCLGEGTIYIALSDEDDKGILNYDGYELWQINCTDSDIINGMCLKCNVQYIFCQDCSHEIYRNAHDMKQLSDIVGPNDLYPIVMCQFKGFIQADYRRNFPDETEEEYIDRCKICPKNVQYYCVNEGSYIDYDGILKECPCITGPNGGNPVFWECKQCQKQIECYDK
jgi:hypothetical protein